MLIFFFLCLLLHLVSKTWLKGEASLLSIWRISVIFEALILMKKVECFLLKCLTGKIVHFIFLWPIFLSELCFFFLNVKVFFFPSMPQYFALNSFCISSKAIMNRLKVQYFVNHVELIYAKCLIFYNISACITSYFMLQQIISNKSVHMPYHTRF